ncbi:MAG: hypothetical protein HY000_05690 [Planctomycetes bacterium]|nr:hypothetical protein [Planctomycetota bacterium]
MSLHSLTRRKVAFVLVTGVVVVAGAAVVLHRPGHRAPGAQPSGHAGRRISEQSTSSPASPTGAEKLTTTQDKAPAPSSPDEGKVRLTSSFLIPQAEDKGLSHTPCVVFTADGKRMLTATSGNEVVVFDTATQKLLRRIRLPEEGTSAVSIDPAGKHAVWVLQKGGIAVVEVTSGRVVKHDKSVTAKWVAVSPDAKRVAISRGNELEIRDVPSMRLVQAVSGHEVEITAMAWSADGKLLGSTAEDGRLLVYDVAAKEPVYEVKKSEPLYAVAFHPTGKFLAYGGHDRQVYEYRMDEKHEEVISQGQPYWITCVGYSPDGDMITAGDESCDIWLYERRSKQLVFHSKHHVECWLASVAWAPDKETFLFGCRPNAHAGQPAVYWGNLLVEAGQSEAAQKMRAELTRTIESQLAQTKDAEEREALLAYQRSLASSGSSVTDNWDGAMMGELGGLGGGIGGGGFGGGGFGGGELEGALQAQGQMATPAFVSGAFSGESVMGVGEGDVAGSSKLAMSKQALEKLPPAVQKLAQDYHKTLGKEAERLKSNYCVNQWKVERK